MPPKARKPKPCDNHPDVDAVFFTDNDGATEELALCEPCVPAHWK